MAPWLSCTARVPPLYNLSVNDHAHVCAPGSKTRPDCYNNVTGREDLGLGVQTGAMAPDFALSRTTGPDTRVRLWGDLLKRKSAVLLTFGAYT